MEFPSKWKPCLYLGNMEPGEPGNRETGKQENTRTGEPRNRRTGERENQGIRTKKQGNVTFCHITPLVGDFSHIF